MEIVPPDPTTFLLPVGTAAIVYARDQPQYRPLPTLKTPDGRVVSPWRPTEAELAQLQAGAALTLVLQTFNNPLQPITLAVGGLDLT